MASIRRINPASNARFRTRQHGTARMLSRCSAMPEDIVPALRNRAYELADTGRYADWAAIAEELARETTPDVLIRRLQHDALFQLMLKARIERAR